MKGKKGWIKTIDQLKKEIERNPELVSNKGAYLNLMNQTNKIAKHSKGISITSQRQYYNHFDQFCRFLSDNYNLKNLRNVQDKHIVAYVVERQSEGKSAATVKQDLAAIRYFHNQLPNARYFLSDNKALAEKYKEFSLEKRHFGGVNRRPTDLEYQSLVNIAQKSKHPNIAYIIQLAREQGLRIHEITRLNRSDAEKAIRNNVLTIKGKGGLVRHIPLRNVTREILKEAMSNVQRGEKLFVSKDEKTHAVIQRTKDFIRNHRDKIYDPTNGRPEGINITMHGFRHAYAKEEYERFLNSGLSENDARYQTSLLIGHSREDVTRIYLGE